MGFWKCVIYMAALGVLSFVIGRLLPKSWFHADRFPYKTAAYEPKIYQALRVKSWQGKVPDISRIFKKIMPEKKMTAETIADVPRMLEETCVAELTHFLLSLLDSRCEHLMLDLLALRYSERIENAHQTL